MTVKTLDRLTSDTGHPVSLDSDKTQLEESPMLATKGKQDSALMLGLLSGEVSPAKAAPRVKKKKAFRFDPCPVDPKVVSAKQKSFSVKTTPAIARVWLGSAATNRSVNGARVNKWANIMRRGEWTDDHPQGLVFDKDGHLIEGQHRLIALLKVAAGDGGVVDERYSIKFWVTVGSDRKVQRDLDSGQTRTMAQTGQILGQNTSAAGISITKGLWMQPTQTKIPRITDRELVLSTYERFEDGINFASLKSANKGSIMVAAVRSVIARAYYHCKDDEQIEKLRNFMYVLDTGLSTSEDHLHAVLVRTFYNSMKRGDKGNMELYAKTMWAVDCCLKGTKVSRLKKAKKQLFPLADFDEHLD